MSDLDIRPLRPADRDEAIALAGDVRAVVEPGSRLHVARGAADSGLVGLAAWREPAGGEPDGLAVSLASGAERTALYRLVRACVLDAIERRHRRGTFTVRNAALLRRLQRDFNIEPEVLGRDPVSQEPVEWQVTVDLQDALRQLDKVLD